MMAGKDGKGKPDEDGKNDAMPMRDGEQKYGPKGDNFMPLPIKVLK
jgi:hypothetical protein